MKNNQLSYELKKGGSLLSKLLLAAILLFVTSYSVKAESAEQQARRQRREQAEQEALDKIKAAIASQNFSFYANQLLYTRCPMMQNINLNASWYVIASPTSLNIYLPVYGTSAISTLPSLQRKMQFVSGKYGYKVEPNGENSWNITMNATDPWSFHTYIFRIQTTPSGNGTYMSVSTPFSSSVTYTGTFIP